MRESSRPSGQPDGSYCDVGHADVPGPQGRDELGIGLRDEWLTRASSYPLFPRGPGLGGAGVVDKLRDLFERKPETAWRSYRAELANTIWWAGLPGQFPELAPATTTEALADIRCLPDGLAGMAGGGRTNALRCTGNGCVPAAVAVAFIYLTRMAGIAE